ncbi:hypothetical protein RHSIM_Rhsim02G0229400 [Rhododendron simsii]|uniref:Uncharacterized protein n=1 Tax=Rhododendron simsii TaxID=118357 RepID=A0A834LVR4_RHOSS|nr:hypothetical protein RHSIM_Rhsim02G0229400 [Rhododendron simsii]
MLLGFLSLLLIGGEGLISAICVSETMGSTWHPCIAISIGLEHVIHLIGKGRRVDVVGVLILAPNRRRRSNFSNMRIRDHGVDVASLQVDVVGVLILAPNRRRRSNFSNMRIRDHGVDVASLQRRLFSVLLVLVGLFPASTCRYVSSVLSACYRSNIYIFFCWRGEELMLLGFLSLLLIGGEGLISAICVSETMGSTWHPCSKKRKEELTTESDYKAREIPWKLLAAAVAISIGLEHVIHLIGKGRRVDVVGVLILAPNRRRRSNFSNMRIRDHGVDVASLQRRLFSVLPVLVGLFLLVRAVVISIGLEHVIHLISKVCTIAFPLLVYDYNA